LQGGRKLRTFTDTPWGGVKLKGDFGKGRRGASVVEKLEYPKRQRTLNTSGRAFSFPERELGKEKRARGGKEEDARKRRQRFYKQ